MIKLYEYIKIKLYYIGCFEHPLVAQLFYILDAEVEKCRELEDEYKRLRAEYVLAINERLSKIDTNARTAFEQYSNEVPTAPKRLLKALYTARTIRRKRSLLWERFKYSR